MDDGLAAPGGQHPDPRPVPASARARLTAAVRDDARGLRPLPPGPTPRAAEEQLPQLPPEEGLEPVRRLGHVSWLVREARSGEPFVLRPHTGTADPQRAASASALRALAVDLAGREDPHLVAVRGLLGPAADPVGLVEEFLPGGSLADRLAEHGRLAPDEVAAVLRDAAAGLAVLHGLGRCHGRLTARQVLFRGAGPGAGLPPAAVRPGTAAGSPADDVRALGAVGWAALTGRAPAVGDHRVPLARLCPEAPPGLLRAVETALAPDPSDRPSAAELAAGLRAPAEADPPGAGPGGSEAGVRTRGRTPARASRRRAALLPAAAVLLLATGTVVLRAAPDSVAPSPAAPAGPAVRTPPEPAVPSAVPEPAVPEPVPSGPATRDGDAAGGPHEALRRLVARRGEALRTGDVQLLGQVYAPGAEAAAADRATIHRAARTGDRAFADLTLEAGPIRGAAPPPGLAEPGGIALETEVRVEGYRGEPGPAPSVVPAGEGWVQSVVVVLVRGEEGWRLAAVEPVQDRGAVAGPATGNPRH
ncbi:protein kinase [Kocuria sabuli]|uniref:protein kinase n=1 Tax=Kocuria sabuli TaxID=3071448 RepID=UPI0034D3FC54